MTGGYKMEKSHTYALKKKNKKLKDKETDFLLMPNLKKKLEILEFS